MEKPLSTIIILLCIISIPFIYITLTPKSSEIVVLPGLEVPKSVATTTATSALYVNQEYGFSLQLPTSWDGYAVATTTEKNGGSSIELRHPLTPEESPRMDIPIIVYSLDQWIKWEKTDFRGYKTAAPIPPTERGRNAKYVFVTAPRYNFSFLPGFEEVEEIIKTLK